MALVLRRSDPMHEPVDLIRLLVRNGLGLRKAHEVLNRVAADEAVPVELPRVEGRQGLVAALARLGVRGSIRQAPRAVDVRSLREGRGLTQREFAVQYGLDLATLRNWEQHRSEPDGPARILLRVLECYPEIVERVVEAAEIA